VSVERFSSYGGGIDPTAVIGHPPESREWSPGDPLFAPSVDGAARVEAFVTIDAGTREATRVGPRAWLMKHVHVGHDAWVGADCELAPGTVVGGHARLGADVRCGVNASILPFVLVGEGARIGAGAVVTKDVPAGEVWVGNPARKIVSVPAPDGQLRCGCWPGRVNSECVFHNPAPTQADGEITASRGARSTTGPPG
jgi:acyl-[acyl carrier protein]--UDP-N-acetylglucosamine O-acyltransferase